jgi:hydroxyacylglutathione hydrolase
MRIIPIKSPGIAHSSYYVSSRGEAFVVDPRRNIEEYLKLAQADCASIKYVFETHRNEDYVIGSLELKNAAEAKICHSKETKFTYGDYALGDGDRFQVGELEVECLWTPGHTVDSICYSLYELGGCESPLAVFTGDTLFIGDVGRTDLPGLETWEKMSGTLFDSLHEKVLPLGDHVIVYPGHTAGSICGSQISDREVSTIGYEKKTNLQLNINRDDFVQNRLNNVMERPPYFRRMEDWNLNGAPHLKNVEAPRMLSPRKFKEESEKGEALILDTRQPDAYAASHIPGSINIWLAGTTYYPGWVIDYNNQIQLITERREDVHVATEYLYRIGFDDISGYLCSGIDAWRNAGMSVETSASVHVLDLKKRLEGGQIYVLDVREEHEYNSGHILGSQCIYVGHLKDRLRELPRDKMICVTCGWGGRGSIAASILSKEGYNVVNLLGGMNAWNASKLPVEKDPEYLESKAKTPVCPL